MLTRILCRAYPASGLQSFSLLFLLAGSAVNGWASTVMGFDSALLAADMAVLATHEPRSDFPCEVTADKPSLGFDLRFHTDYLVTVPVKVLAQAGDWLRVVMRVSPAADGAKALYLVERFDIPDVPEGAKGEFMLAGGFEVGLGRYRVDWVMRDSRERFCSSHWDLEAKPERGQRDLPLTLGPNMVADWGQDAFGAAPQDRRDPPEPLNVKIMLNLSPVKPEESVLKPRAVTALFSMLSSITHVASVGHVTLIAFNLREQKIIYQQEKADKIDFTALAKAVQSPTAGTIDYHLLKDPRSETRFLTKLLTDQLGTQAESPDAIIIAGARIALDRKVPLESLRAGGAAVCPIFYLSYNPNPIEEPSSDTIGSALIAYKMALAYNIARPRDWGVAMKDMLSRIVKQRASKAGINSVRGANLAPGF
jgi:hypothetical protein